MVLRGGRLAGSEQVARADWCFFFFLKERQIEILEDTRLKNIDF